MAENESLDLRLSMVRRALDLGDDFAVLDSVSCVHYPLRVRGQPKQCGLCLGCLGRQQAALAAGLDITSQTEAFQHDMFDPNCAGLPTEQLAFLREQLLQIGDLHELTVDGSRPEILRRHLSASGAVTLGDRAEDWTALLTRFRDEWMQVIAFGRDRGCQWAKWIDGYDRAGGRETGHGGIDERTSEPGSKELRRAACAIP